MSKPQKNVLLICTDHWPGPLLGCEGHNVIQTPTMDELARTGTPFITVPIQSALYVYPRVAP